MSNLTIFALILIAWAAIGMIGLIFDNYFRRANWCLVFFFFFVPVIPFIAKFFNIF